MKYPLAIFGNTLFVIMLCLSPGTVQAEDATSSEAELDQMMAPIALYPDALLAQILMAATYPADVAEAVKWSKDNPDQDGDAAVKAVQDKSWDPSVMSLVAFPQVLAMMGEQPDWVQNVGDAFLADSEAVMDTVQKLRSKAKEEGNLETSEQQTVIVEEPSSSETVIIIEPADPADRVCAVLQSDYYLWHLVVASLHTVVLPSLRLWIWFRCGERYRFRYWCRYYQCPLGRLSLGAWPWQRRYQRQQVQQHQRQSQQD